jgi:hypothetical protein
MKTLEENIDPLLEAANIRPVPKIFEREGLFHHELKWKKGPYAIYRYYYIQTENPEPHWKYEAVILRIMEPHPKSTDRRLKEALPSNSEWGQFGWSLSSFQKALEQIDGVKSKRGKAIESNYYSNLKSGMENSNNSMGGTRNTTLPPCEAHQP